MNIKVQNCTYYCAKEKIKWNLSYQDDKALLAKTEEEKKLFSSNCEKKQMAKEYLSNLDIFFSVYLMDKWSELPTQEGTDAEENDYIAIKCDGIEYQVFANQILPDTEQSIFEDMQRYFTACFEETAKPTYLSFHSFDGGGPQYSLEIHEKGIFTWYSQRHYSNPDHENLCGSGYNIEYQLYPLRKGNATATLIGDSPICPEPERKIYVEVDEKLNMEHHIEEGKVRR